MCAPLGGWDAISTASGGTNVTAREIPDREFDRIRRWVYDTAGISLGPAKKALVAGRLAKRLQVLHCATFREYLQLLENSDFAAERQTALDLLTTNETYFFRESKHFEFLENDILGRLPRGRTVRIWSAACSSGEEPYSIAMILNKHLGSAMWEVVASDLSTRVLAKARAGIYPLERIREMPKPYLHKYCLQGTGPYAGQVLIARALRQRVQFLQVNLNAPLPHLGEFDVVFLRNVMIYFDAPTKAAVVRRIASTLKAGGHLLIGHSESLNGITDQLVCLKPSIYLKPSPGSHSRAAAQCGRGHLMAGNRGG